MRSHADFFNTPGRRELLSRELLQKATVTWRLEISMSIELPTPKKEKVI